MNRKIITDIEGQTATIEGKYIHLKPCKVDEGKLKFFCNKELIEREESYNFVNDQKCENVC